MSVLTPERLVALLGLQPLPIEGGYFRQTYLASQTMPSSGASTLPRPAGSAIFYLLHGPNFSALHRLRTDELYHFYLGDPVQMLLLYPDGSIQQPILGQDLEAGHHLQFLVPAGVWQASQLIKQVGGFALLGTTMAPAFDQAEFELGLAAHLMPQYPSVASRIQQLAG